MDDFLALKRLRDWLVQHPGYLIFDAARNTPLDQALYHSEGIALFETDLDHTYAMMPVLPADTSDMSDREQQMFSDLAHLIHAEAEQYDMTATAVVVEAIDALFQREREQP